MTVLVCDGPVIVQMLKPDTAKTFMQYYQEVFLPYVQQQMCFVQRMDIVWDDYTSNSLKICTRERRAKGSRKRVLPKTPIPTSWHSFLCNDANKKELFAYLRTAIIQNPLPDQIIVTTHKRKLLSSSPINSSNLEPCNHEEADSRIFVHVLDAIKQGHSKIMIRTVDTDVQFLQSLPFHFLQGVITMPLLNCGLLLVLENIFDTLLLTTWQLAWNNVALCFQFFMH